MEDIHEESIVFKGRELKQSYPLSVLAYNIDDSTWKVVHDEFMIASYPLCQTMSNPVNTQGSTNKELLSMTTCGDNSECEEVFYPGCQRRLLCEEARKGNCCPFSQLIELGILTSDLELLSQMDFNKLQKLDCLVKEDIGMMTVQCVSSKWVVSSCRKEVVQKCAAEVVLPLLYTVLDTSALDNDTYISGDIMLLDCDNEYTDTEPDKLPRRFTCTDRGWQPALSQLKTDDCTEKIQNNAKVNWLYEPKTKVCYGLLRTKVTYDNAVDYCEQLEASLAKIESGAASRFVTNIIARFTTRNSGFWISGLCM